MNEGDVVRRYRIIPRADVKEGDWVGFNKFGQKYRDCVRRLPHKNGWIDFSGRKVLPGGVCIQIIDGFADVLVRGYYPTIMVRGQQ